MLGNDIYPANDIQIAATSTLAISGAFVLGNVFGILSDLVFSLLEDNMLLQSKVDSSNTACVHFDLPHEISNQCMTHIRGSHKIQRDVEEVHEFLMTLSPKLSSIVIKFLTTTVTVEGSFLGDAKQNLSWMSEVERFSTYLILHEY